MSNRSIQFQDKEGKLYPTTFSDLVLDRASGEKQSEINASIINLIGEQGTLKNYNGYKVKIYSEGTQTVFLKKVLTTSYGSHFDHYTWAGGLAIANGIAILSYNRGDLVMIDWSDKSFLASGQAACYSTSTHANNCAFGNTYYNGNNIPLLYISECDEWNKRYRCFVENIIRNGSNLTCTNVQTITYTGSKLNSDYTTDWAVDTARGFLYGYGYLGDHGSYYNKLRIMRFRLPDISVKNVTLTDSDILETHETSIDGVLQGCAVSNGLFIFPYSANVNNGKSIEGNGVRVFDFEKNLDLCNFSLYDFTKSELEGAALYDGKAYLTAHVSDNNNADAEYIELDFK